MTSDSLIRTDATAVCEAAYAFAFPLVHMELTRRQKTAVPTPDPATMRAPPNRLVHARGRPGARAGTMRSSAWLDLADGPVILSVSDTHGRYYLLSLIDMWTSAFASVGARTTGTGAGLYAIGLRGMDRSRLPAGVLPIIAPTRYVHLTGQTCLERGEGEPEAGAIRAGYSMAPLDGAAPRPVAAGGLPPPERLDVLDARSFFGLATELLADNPPRERDREVVEAARELGLLGPAPWLGDDERSQRAVEEATDAARARIRARAAAALGEASRGWHIDYRRARFGTDYLRRAAAASSSLGTDAPEDLLPALTLSDAAGRPLTGAHRYLLRFGPDTPPPVHGFWALTVAGEGRSLGDRDGLTVDGDGSLPIVIQRDVPPRAWRSNWLPAPPRDFALVLELYWPRDEVLSRRWTPPAVTRVD